MKFGKKFLIALALLLGVMLLANAAPAQEAEDTPQEKKDTTQEESDAAEEIL